MNRTRRGVKRAITRVKGANGSYLVTITHYRDGHFSLKINEKKAVRVNARTARIFVEYSDIASL